MDSPNQERENDVWRDAEWARLQLLRMLARLLDGHVLPQSPWLDTRPDVRRIDRRGAQ